MPHHFQCPSCAQTLTLNERTLRCDNNHSFDLAKEGYANLLLAQNKKSKNPGDNKVMMLCRRQFLEAGHYDFLVKTIAQLIAPYSPNEVLDIGCGEGFYLNALKTELASQQISFEAHGLDIAKEGVRLAAKRKQGCEPLFSSLAVASAYDLPYSDASFAAALSVFSPLQETQTTRILKANAKLLVVGPGENHLKGLAECIYNSFRPHKPAPLLSTEHWQLEHEKDITETLTVKGEQIYNLLTMTPYFWSCAKEKQEQLKQQQELITPASFNLRVYSRR